MGSCMSTETEKSERNKSEKLSRSVRKRRVSEVLAASAKNDELIALVPGRTCSNGSSRIASLFTQQGRKGVNQDAMLVWEGFGTRKNSVLCGVFDGHGPYGHLVARRVRDSLPSKLLSELQEVSFRKSQAITLADEVPRSVGTDGNIECEVGNWLEPEMFSLWKDSYLTAYKSMDTELRAHPSIDCFCSGTTAVTVLKQGQDLVIANVGDSRAVLGTKAENGTLRAIQLTVDLKPNLPGARTPVREFRILIGSPGAAAREPGKPSLDMALASTGNFFEEAERIKQCKGRIFALHDEPEVHRVWLPHDNSPGLAMARAFGDFCLKDFGVIAVPEISYRQLTDRDEFIILATDGIWDVLNNTEAVDIIATAPTRRTAARSLVECAVRAWRLKYPTSKVDDCAVVCLYMDDNVVSHQLLVRKDGKSFLRTRQDLDDSRSINATSYAIDQGKECTPVTTSEIEDEVLVEWVELSHESTDAYSSKLTTSKGMIDPESGRVLLAQRSLKECLATNEDEWSALEGITRVNSLMNLPRFPGPGSKGMGASEQQCQ